MLPAIISEEIIQFCTCYLTVVTVMQDWATIIPG